MLTAQQLAEKWNVSVRYVQSLCSRGKIPGAQHFGKHWMIPDDAVRPPDGRRKEARSASSQPRTYQPLPRKSPFLNMTDLYTVPGTADARTEALAYHPEAQALFAAEIAYCRGQIDKVYADARYLLHEHSGMFGTESAGMLLALTAIWRGDVLLWHEAKVHIFEAPFRTEQDRDIVALSLACVNSAIRDLAEYPDWFSRGIFGHLPPDAHPAAWVYYVKYLLLFAQDLAMKRLKLEDVTGLGLMKCLPYIAEPLISQAAVEHLVIPEIHLRLLCAIAYHHTGNDPRASDHIDRAIALALPDRLLGPLVEYRRQLDFLLDDRLKLADPGAFREYTLLHRQYLEGWTTLHNAVLDRTLSARLSIRERQIARLAAYGFTNPEISARLNISESAAKKGIYDAMNKTGVSRREELAAFV